MDYPAICSGLAIDRAREDYRDVAKEREIQRALPEAWNRLVAEGNESLLKLLAEKVESVCGFKPDLETVAGFLLNGLRSQAIQPQPPVRISRPVVAHPKATTPPAPKPEEVQTPRRSGIGVELLGQWYPAKTGSDLMVRFLQLVTDRDPGFAERFVTVPRKSSKRRHIARSPQDLYPSTPGLATKSGTCREFRPGWWVDVNKSTGKKLRSIELACGIANLQYGNDVKVNLE